MKKVAIIGMGISGESAHALLKKKYETVCFDQKLGNDHLPYDFTGFEFAVLSPGIPSTHQLVQCLEKQGIPIISEIELAFRYLQGRTIIGITGTNGKTTVTQMIAHCLNFLGIKAHAVGNVGRPLTDAIDEEGVLVVELSSFQLERTFTPALDIAILLRIAPDHLDRYASFKEYADAKARIATLIKPNGHLIVNRDVTKLYPYLPFEQVVGFKNEEAVLAALKYFDKTALEINQALATFRTAPHRIEWVKEINGVNFYNDSKATNVDSVLYALKSMRGPIYLIAGGKHKGSPYTPLRPYLEEKVEKMFLIGEAAEQMAQELHSSVSIHVSEYLDKAIEQAFKEAPPGSSILLSPGCSSYDQFKNYEERGNHFKQLVQEIGSSNQRNR